MLNHGVLLILHTPFLYRTISKFPVLQSQCYQIIPQRVDHLRVPSEKTGLLKTLFFSSGK